MTRVAREGLRHGLRPARPPHWGGFRIAPRQIEFWADGAFRLHDRFQWRLQDGSWQVTRLNP
jgi:pyridoxamine 5'-phosphate oxidase